MRLPRSHLWPGVPLALVSAVLFGASAPFAKVLLGTVDPQLLAGLMYLGAGLGLAIVHFGRGAIGLPAREAPLRRKEYPWLAAVVLAGGIAAPLLLMMGLARTSASSGSLLLNLEGLATMAIAWLAFRENVDRRLLLGRSPSSPERCWCRGADMASTSMPGADSSRPPALPGASTTT